MDGTLLLFASAAGSASGSGGFAAILVQVLPLVAIVGIFYFLLIRPQQRQMKEHKNKLAGIKRNDTVVTGGGLIGKVIKVDEAHVEIDLGNGTKVRAVKAMISDVMEKGSSRANDE